jgi:alpha-ketoglutarate-dependent taurine dioxygenase
MHTISPFKSNEVLCSFNPETYPALIVSPRVSDMDSMEWARNHQEEIAQAVDTYGGILFNGFRISKEDFREFYTLAAGQEPESYQGDTPRPEVEDKIYISTVVANGSAIPPHQEDSANHSGYLEKIGFCCLNPPKPGTGQTRIADAKAVSLAIEERMPDLWQRMTTTTLTYTCRYLPKDSWRTRWIRWLNPSHATIEQRFDTDNKEAIANKCREEGLQHHWDGDWLVVERSGVPATIDIEGVTVFFNQIYLDRLNPELCGGWFFYLLARILLYPTSRSMQFDVKFDDGLVFSRSEASDLLKLIKQFEKGIDWEAGDVLILNNLKTMHAKSPHKDESEENKRQIIVAMSGYHKRV